MGHIHEKIDFVVAAYIVNNDKVLLVDHLKLKSWLPVGGHIELDEDPDQALFREIEEECGLKVEILSPRGTFKETNAKPLLTPSFVDIHNISDSHRHIGLVYFATSKDDNAVLAEREHKELRWFTEDDLERKEFGLLENVKFYSKEALKAARKK